MRAEFSLLIGDALPFDWREPSKLSRKDKGPPVYSCSIAVLYFRVIPGRDELGK